VICGEVLSDGATLVSATADKEVKVWEEDPYLSNNQCTNTFSSHNHSVSVMIEVGRGIIATAFSNKIIRIWDITTGEEGKIFFPPTYQMVGGRRKRFVSGSKFNSDMYMVVRRRSHLLINE